MKYFTIFLILIVLVNADADCTAGENHCAVCNPCNEDVCQTCEEDETAKEKGWQPMWVQDLSHPGQCKCNTEGGYSITDADKVCVHCDNGCTSGCAKKGYDYCDSACNTVGYWFDEDNFVCEHCDKYCSTDPTDNWCKKKGADKCDEKCISGYRLDVDPKDDNDEVNTGTYKCQQCDENCSKCDEKGAGKCDPTSPETHQGNCNPGYSLIKEGDNAWTCVKCDEGCTSGCSVEGKGKVEGKCDSTCNTDGGYSFISEKKICAKCDEHCDMTDSKGGCKEKGKDGADGFCDEKCITGYKLDSSFHCIPICSDKIAHCAQCDTSSDKNEYKCVQCETGYYLKEGANPETETNPDQCLPIDCKPLDNHCSLCVHEDVPDTTHNRNELRCIQCESGYLLDNDYKHEDNNEGKYQFQKCEKENKLIKCEKKVGEKVVDTKYFKKDKCYAYYNEHTFTGYNDEYEVLEGFYKYKVDNGKLKKCRYNEQECDYDYQAAQASVPTTCVTYKTVADTPVDKYFKVDECSADQKTIKEYNKDCKEVTGSVSTTTCYKVADNDYVKIDSSAHTFVHYFDKECTSNLVIYKDADCDYETYKEYECTEPKDDDSSNGPTPDPEDETCNVKKCKEGKCSDNKETCEECISGYHLSDDKKTCIQDPSGSSESENKDGSIMNIIMLTILIISLMI